MRRRLVFCSQSIMPTESILFWTNYHKLFIFLLNFLLSWFKVGNSFLQSLLTKPTFQNGRRQWRSVTLRFPINLIVLVICIFGRNVDVISIVGAHLDGWSRKFLLWFDTFALFANMGIVKFRFCNLWYVSIHFLSRLFDVKCLHFIALSWAI